MLTLPPPRATHYTVHGDPTVGYEVMPINVAYTAEHLRLNFDEWDYTRPAPQAAAYKAWLKSHLVEGEPIVWFPICKGDSHQCYPGSCPSGGTCDHVEPMYGIFSNHPLSDPTVYDDDWILHASDQDLLPYYRKINSLDDTLAMGGNCKNAGSGFGKNEMFPCIYDQVTYGLAVTGLNVTGTLPLALTTDGAVQEPDVRTGAPPAALSGAVWISGLTPGASYAIYRYNSTGSLPAGPPFEASAFMARTPFVATASTFNWTDPVTFPSNTAVYYIAAPAA